MRQSLLSGCVAACVVGLSGVALADTECGWVEAGWNAPNGAVVFNRGPGPIRDVLDAVGEYRTHSMLSHGPGLGVSHATMKTPTQTDWPTLCSLPLKPQELREGYPGLQQVNQGAIYTYMYTGFGTEWAGWQRGEAGAAAVIGDSIWYNHPFVTEASRADGTQYMERPLRNRKRVGYSLFQYRTLESVHHIPGDATNNGMVCSTFLAYAHNYAGRGFVSAYTYPHHQIANASNSLYTGVYNTCRESLGWFTGVVLTVVCPFNNVCGNAGSQITNCMSTNRCNDSNGNIWRGVRDDPGATATSISPDRIGGWGVHPYNLTTWSPDYTHPLQWNSGGNVYGCWQ